MPENYGTLWEMLDKRLEGLESGQNAIKTDVAVIKDRQAAVITDISGVKTTLYGNGKPGLITEMALNRQKTGLLLTILGTLGGIIAAAVIGQFKSK